jgi:2-succinyl-5-enolpyruvyl-6-hydroxy-3-cyclohexene-1-carboxylate synthase
VLITIGDAVVSKRIKALIIKNKPELHIAINYSDIGIDSFHCIGMHLKTSALSFFKALNVSDLQSNTMNYKSSWTKLDNIAKESLPDFFTSEKSNTDIRVFNAINERLEINTTLHMSNSSVVRYMQLFDPGSSIKYECNRGTSGIDGSLSTAVGSALASPGEKHLAISGDVSFIYDSNALWIRPFPKNLKMIVIDNQGGGIFRIIDGASSSNQLERFFEAKHEASVIEIANGFGISAIEVDNLANFENSLNTFFNNSAIQLLVIRTDSNENPKALSRLFKHIKNA